MIGSRHREKESIQIPMMILSRCMKAIVFLYFVGLIIATRRRYTKKAT